MKDGTDLDLPAVRIGEHDTLVAIADVYPGSMPDLDNPTGLQPAQGFPEGGCGYGEPLGERSYGRKAISWA